jgi:hypothetical protein
MKRVKETLECVEPAPNLGMVCVIATARQETTTCCLRGRVGCSGAL